MGLMDKVKAQANQVAQRTQDAAREGKARIDQAQANRQADTMLRNLGVIVYAEQTGRGTSHSQDDVAKLIGQISAHEAENGINLGSQPTGGPGVPPQASGSDDMPSQGGGSSDMPPQGGGSGGVPPQGGQSTGFPPEAGSGPAN